MLFVVAYLFIQALPYSPSLQHAPGSCLYTLPCHNQAVVQGAPGSSYWKAALDTDMWVPDVLVASEV